MTNEFRRVESGALIPPRSKLDEWRNQHRQTEDLKERVENLESKLDLIIKLLETSK